MDYFLTKKIALILVLIVALLLVIKVAVHKFIPSLLSTFISIEEIEKEKLEELIVVRKKFDYKHLSIYYLASDEKLLPVTKEALDRAIILNEDLFGPNYNDEYNIIIFKDNKETEDYCRLEYAIGCHLERVKTLGLLPEDKDGVIENVPPLIWNYKKNIIHEYTHYVFTQKTSENGLKIGLTNNDIPLWLSEGIAEYIGSAGEARHELELGPKVVSLKELSTYDQWNKYRIDNQYNVYLQAQKAIYFLIDEYGVDIINRIILETLSEGQFSEGFQSATSLKVEELDDYLWDLSKEKQKIR